MKIFGVLFLLVGLLGGCAMPPSQPSRASLISAKDLLAVRLVKDGLAFFAAGRNSDALFKLEQARYLTPNSPKIKYNLVMVLLANGQEEVALALLQRLLEVEPENLRYLEGLGRIYLSQLDYGSAKQAFEKGLKLALDNDKDQHFAAQFSANLATLSLRLGLEEESLCLASQAFNLEGSDRNLAGVLRILNSVSLSQVILDRHARAPLPNDVDVQAELGLAMLVNGDKEHAHAILEKFSQRKQATSFSFRVLAKLLPVTDDKKDKNSETDSNDASSEKSLSLDDLVYLPAGLVNDLI